MAFKLPGKLAVMIYPSTILGFIYGPIRTEVSDGRIILTHLQKYSNLGFLLTWPFCFHFWLFWKRQSQTAGPLLTKLEPQYEPLPGDKWIPGSERGIYCRTPGYRWDADLGMKWTWGYFGPNWD